MKGSSARSATAAQRSPTQARRIASPEDCARRTTPPPSASTRTRFCACPGRSGIKHGGACDVCRTRDAQRRRSARGAARRGLHLGHRGAAAHEMARRLRGGDHQDRAFQERRGAESRQHEPRLRRQLQQPQRGQAVTRARHGLRGGAGRCCEARRRERHRRR